jgi:hypothetical protein
VVADGGAGRGLEKLSSRTWRAIASKLPTASFVSRRAARIEVAFSSVIIPLKAFDLN